MPRRCHHSLLFTGCHHFLVMTNVHSLLFREVIVMHLCIYPCMYNNNNNNND